MWIRWSTRLIWPKLHDLADAGLVAKTKAGKEILFINERLVKLLAN